MTPLHRERRTFSSGQFVSQVPPYIWYRLSLHDCEVLMLLDDFLAGRKTVDEFVARYSEFAALDTTPRRPVRPAPDRG